MLNFVKRVNASGFSFLVWILFLKENVLLYELLCFHVNMIKKTHTEP